MTPAQVNDLYEEARQLHLNGGSSEALDRCDRIIAADPTHAHARYLRGVVQKNLGYVEAALDDMNVLLHSDENYLDAYYCRATLHNLIENWTSAVDDFTAFLRLRQDASMDYDVYLLRGLAQRQLKRWDAAIADLTRAIELKPDDGSTYMRRYLVYQDMGESEKAKADFTLGKKLLSSSKSNK